MLDRLLGFRHLPPTSKADPASQAADRTTWPLAPPKRVDHEAARGEHLGDRTVHDLLDERRGRRAVHQVDAHPVVLAPRDDDAAQLRLRDQAGTADLAPAPRASCSGSPASDSEAVDLDDQGGQRVLVGEQCLPVVGQPLELLTEVGEPRPVLR